jgi:hypothetical protein
MMFIRREIDRIHGALTSSCSAGLHAELYAAQQALVWVLDQDTYKAPCEMLARNIPADSKDCQAENDLSVSSDNPGPRVV